MVLAAPEVEQLPEPPGPVTATETLTVADPAPTPVAKVEVLKVVVEVLLVEVGARLMTPEVGVAVQVIVELVALVGVTVAVILP